MVDLEHAAVVSVMPDTPEQRGRAEALASRLGLRLVHPDGVEEGVTLAVTSLRLELRWCGTGGPGPVYVDFCAGQAAYRRLHGGGVSQAIARAVGVKRGRRPSVVDATAGLARDAFVLACLGCHVRLIEREPVVHALVADAMERARQVPEVAEIVCERMRLLLGDGKEVAQLVGSELPDVVYLDPMYPEARGKRALPRKEMRLLRSVVGPDDDCEALLAAALRCARYRVVVKRPSHAQRIPGPRPTAAITTRSHRFEIYTLGTPPPPGQSFSAEVA